MLLHNKIFWISRSFYCILLFVYNFFEFYKIDAKSLLLNWRISYKFCFKLYQINVISGASFDLHNIMESSMLVNASGWTSLLTFFVISLAWLVGFSSRLFSVIRFESIIHEFDPWFNYRSTHYMVENGFYNFLNWFDDRAWYPLGRIVGGTVYPGLMITSGKWILRWF